MDSNEHEWAWQKLTLDKELSQIDGDAFETRFQYIAKAAWGDDFTPTIPMGRRGDLKCDGRRESTKTVFQCYGPRYGQADVDAALQKIEQDFSGACEHWGDELNNWIFVANLYSDRVPSEIPRRIAELSSKLGVKARSWNRSDIVDLAQRLNKEKRRELFGRAPLPTDMARVSYENIGRILAKLKRDVAASPGEHVPLPPDLVAKIEWNALPATAAHFLSIGYSGSERVRTFLADQSTPDDAEEMAAGFVDRYLELRRNASTPEVVFQQMLFYAGGATGRPDDDSVSLAILAHFFSTCQIFERPREVT